MTYLFTACFTCFFLTLGDALFSSCRNWTQAGGGGGGGGGGVGGEAVVRTFVTRHLSPTTTITLLVHG